MTSVFFPAKFLISEITAENHLDISVTGDFKTVQVQQPVSEEGHGSNDITTMPQKPTYPHTIWGMDLWMAQWKHSCFYCCFQSPQSQPRVFVIVEWVVRVGGGGNEGKSPFCIWAGHSHWCFCSASISANYRESDCSLEILVLKLIHFWSALRPQRLHLY